MSETDSSAVVSTTGKRDHNEDSFAADSSLGLYAVADGVGGHSGGEVASAIAIATVREVIAKWRTDPDGVTPTAAAAHALEQANAAVYAAAQKDPKKGGMATTLTLMLVDEHLGHMAHVGDSRLYLIRDGEVHQLSTDQTLAAELVRGGVIPREQVESHPHSHVLTRSCGTQPEVAIETLQFELHPDDVYLLSSDGLNPVMTEAEQVVDLLGPGRSLAEGVAELVERSKALGSSDNITAVVWRCSPEVPPASANTLAALRTIPLFERLPTADLLRVASLMQRRSFEPGDVVLTKGEVTSKLVVVTGGQLRWELEPGRFALLKRGEGMGQTSLMRARRAPGQLSAEEAADVLILGGDEFRRLLRRRERLGVMLLSALAEELSEWLDPDSDVGVARPPHGTLVAF